MKIHWSKETSKINKNYLIWSIVLLLIVLLIIFIIKFCIPIYKKDLYSKFNEFDKNNKINDEKFVLPRKLHQVWLQGYDNIHNSAKQVIDENLKMNSNWEYKFYDAKAIDKYIKENESDYVYQAYKKINPKYSAVITDLFRYIIMYHEGGVYMDIKCKTNVPLDNWVHKNKLQVSLFGFENILLKKYFNCEVLKDIVPREFIMGILVYSPKHIIMRILIDEICEKIHNYKNNQLNYLPNKLKNSYKILSLTGPWAYTKILSAYICNLSPEDVQENIIIYNKNGMNGVFNGYILVDGTKGEYWNDQSKRKIHYSEQEEDLIL